ncbi:hypothetical protein [Acidiphilium multivorum]|nr:hypothetical protein [Acidiphilium multivorum]
MDEGLGEGLQQHRLDPVRLGAYLEGWIPGLAALVAVRSRPG